MWLWVVPVWSQSDGQPTRARGGQGTYREVWKLQWRPDFAIQVIEASIWGNTVVDATAVFAQDGHRYFPETRHVPFFCASDGVESGSS